MLRLLLVAAAVASMPARPAAADASPAAPAASGAITEAQVQSAVATLRAEEAGTHKAHVLRWISDKKKPERPEPLPAWFRWLRAFGGWLADTSRVLVWAGGALLVAIGVVSARHLLRARRLARQVQAGGPVSHVRDLDVRPQSLPEDVGAAAWSLWQAGRGAESLSLLYRGALSRLIHRHGVPVAAASTEGECVALARAHAPAPAHAYLGRLVRAWQACVYGGHAPDAAQARSLCDDFDIALAPSPAAADGPAAAAGAAA